MKRLVVLVAVLFSLSSVASAALITNVARSGGASGTRDPIGTYNSDTAPLASDSGGLAAGVYVFSDRTMHYSVVPNELIGAEYIRTFNSDKSYDGSVTYVVTLSSNCIFAITIDDRFTNQQAMVDGIAAGVVPAGTFVDTGLDLVTDESTQRTLSVFAAPLSAGVYTFVGYGYGGSNNFMTMGAMIPEPATIALLGIGSLALIRKKR